MSDELETKPLTKEEQKKKGKKYPKPIIKELPVRYEEKGE